MQAVIPAAGMALRLLPGTKETPKEMFPIIDKPVIHYIVEEAVNSGIDDITIVTGRNKHAIEDYFDRNLEIETMLAKKGKFAELKELNAITDMAEINFVRQKEPLGLGHAIYCARRHIHEPFAVLLGDDLFYSDVPATKQMMDFYNSYIFSYGHQANIVAVKHVPACDLDKYGIVKPASSSTHHQFPIKDIVEKPGKDKAPSDMGAIGRYILDPGIFTELESVSPGYGGEIQLTDAIRSIIGKQAVYAFQIQGTRFDVGDRESYVQATLFEAKRRGYQL